MTCVSRLYHSCDATCISLSVYDITVYAIVFFLCEYTLFVSCILNECKFLSFRIPQLPSFWRLAMSRYIIEVLSDRLDSFICMVKIKTKFTVTGSKNNIDNYYIKKRLALIKMCLFDLLLFVNYQSPALFVITHRAKIDRWHALWNIILYEFVWGKKTLTWQQFLLFFFFWNSTVQCPYFIN